MGNAIKDNATKLDIYEKEIKTLQKKLDKAKKAAAKLLNLAIEKVISKGTTYSEKMDTYEKEVTVLEDQLSKALARRRAADMSIHSSEYFIAQTCGLPWHIWTKPPQKPK